jgi:hypothetical protein
MLNADAPAKQVERFAEAKRLLPVAAVWNGRPGSAFIQFLAQFGAVVNLVAKHTLRGLYPPDQACCGRAVVRFTSVNNGDEASFSIASAWIFVLRPPRERPTACFCSLFSARCRAVRFDVRSRSSAYPWIVRSQQAPGTKFPRCHAAPSVRSGNRSSSADHKLPGNRTSGSRT